MNRIFVPHSLKRFDASAALLKSGAAEPSACLVFFACALDVSVAHGLATSAYELRVVQQGGSNAYIESAREKTKQALGSAAPDFSKAAEASKRFMSAGTKILFIQKAPPQDASGLNQALIAPSAPCCHARAAQPCVVQAFDLCSGQYTDTRP